jgi:PleD family two-component response regulator
MTGSLRVLMLKNSEPDAEMIKQELSRAGLAPVTRCVDTEREFVSALDEFSPDVVISNDGSPQFGATAALGLLRTLRPAIQ